MNSLTVSASNPTLAGRTAGGREKTQRERMQTANPVKVRIEAGVQTGSPKSLAHLPGWRAFGPIDNTLWILRDSRSFYEASEKRFGRVFTSSFLGSRNVRFLGPDANEWMLADRERSFSSQLGWRPYLDRVFRARRHLDGFR
jgi:hypothetical protein